MPHAGKGITLLELSQLFPDEEAARRWFEQHLWPNGRACPKCGSVRTHEASHKNSPYRCSDCHAYFSVKTGTAMDSSRIPLRKWAYAIYIEVTSLKGVSSMKLHRDIGVTQTTAWFMLHRLRQAWATGVLPRFTGPVEADEMYVGGKAKNRPRGAAPSEKIPVVGIKDRSTRKVIAKAVATTEWSILQAVVRTHVRPGATIYTDAHGAYRGLPNHEWVAHTEGEYARGAVHTNGIESFWSMFKRAYVGTYHRMSPKHLQRYLNEFAGRHGIRTLDTIEQMGVVAQGLAGKPLRYRVLTA